MLDLLPILRDKAVIHDGFPRNRDIRDEQLVLFCDMPDVRHDVGQGTAEAQRDDEIIRLPLGKGAVTEW